MTLSDRFDKGKVSRFLDQVLDDTFDIKTAQASPQAVLEDLGISVSPADRDRLANMSMGEMLGRNPADTVRFVPAAAVAVLCWPSEAH
ncbi:MAG: hypothetical protein Q8Q62_18150 [Mesorhizobium sp.]|nr:hypothetical protein [Mesorhizobium sp.]